MATRTSPELLWGSFWTAFLAQRGGGDYYDDGADENISRSKKATPLGVEFACLDVAMRSTMGHAGKQRT
eukprot:12226937-Alexandrium_andersonii.AAC.1